MRGEGTQQGNLFSYLSPEQRVPNNHPLRPIRAMVNEILGEMHSEFSALYSHTGRPSIPPEHLLRAMLLQILYTIRSERQLMEQIDFNILYRWFVGLGLDDPIWDPTVFCKNRDRLLDGEVARAFLDRVIRIARERKLMSREHFTVDGTLIEAWASHKSFKPKDRPKDDPPSTNAGNPDADFRGEKRTNDTHESTTDSDARLYRKGRNVGAQLCYMGHVLMENRNGLVVTATVTTANGLAERATAASMLGEVAGEHRITCGADKNYDTEGFVAECRNMKVTPHVAQNIGRRSSRIDGRTTGHEGYSISQRVRKRVEEIFGWIKTVGGMRKTKFRGQPLVRWFFEMTVAMYNLVRIRNLCDAARGTA